MLVNQSLWSEFGAVEELSEQTAENISGGAFRGVDGQETFTITNETKYKIPILLDGTASTILPGASWIYTTGEWGDGKLSFDSDIRPGIQAKTYNLSDGSVYEFQNNKKTPGNPYDFDLYRIV